MFLFMCSAAFAGNPVVAEFVADLDTMIDENHEETNYAVTGNLEVANRYSGQMRQILYYFDISSIPDNMTINSAVLTLDPYTSENDDSSTFDAYRAWFSWGEYDAWEDVNDGGVDTQAFSGKDKGSHTGTGTWNVKSIVEDWYDGSETNNGFLLSDSGSTTNNGAHDMKFWSREATGEDEQPRLVIVYGDLNCSPSGTAPAGDVNNDGKVDFTDFLILADNYGFDTGKVWADGDMNCDGIVQFVDFLILAQNYGYPHGAGSEPPAP